MASDQRQVTKNGRGAKKSSIIQN